MTNFIENTELLTTKGVLNRRNFIINFLKVEVVKSVILTTPLFYIIFIEPKTLLHISKGIMPFWLTCYNAIVGLIILALLFPSIVKRVRDILGIEDDNKIHLSAATLAVLMYMNYTPVGTNFTAKWIVFFLIGLLMIQIGKISSTRAKDKVIKFNWGAFLGTWMWGIFNKVKPALYILPLYLTFGWLPYQLICGLKGNEWAYKKENDIDEFHKSQSNQSKAWFFTAPIVYLTILLIVSIIIEFSLVSFGRTNPAFLEKIKNTGAKIEQYTVEANFDKIEITDEEYKFYINPKAWDKGYKKSIFDNAILYVFIKNNKNYYSTKTMIENIELAKKTKIYSTFDNDILAEFEPDSEKLKKAYENSRDDKSYKEFYKEWNKGYKLHE